MSISGILGRLLGLGETQAIDQIRPSLAAPWVCGGSAWLLFGSIGLVVLAGSRFGPGQLAQTLLGDLLPVKVDPNARARDRQPFRLQRTADAAQYDFMRLGESGRENEAAWENLGPLAWYQPVERLRPLATALAEHPADTCVDGKTLQPLVAIQNYGRGEVVYLGFNETWRLRRRYGERYYRQFWGQLIHRLALRHALGAQKRFVVRTDRRTYQADDHVLLTVEAYDADFQPLAEDDVPQHVLAGELILPERELSGEPNVRPLSIAQLRPGVFETQIPVFAAGEHRVRVQDPIAEEDVEVAFQVARVSAERQRAVRNVALEKAIAEATAGRSYDLGNVDKLPDEIAELAQAARALDEAAAAERDIAQASKTAADAEGLAADAANELGRRQADVADVAASVAEGVEESVPEAAKMLGEASQPLEETRKQLQAAAEQPGQPSEAPAAEASQQADQAASKLAEAAGEIRREIERTAQELASLSGEQLDQATEARQTVETAIEDRPESIADRLQQLAEAERKVREAAADQQRAAGRPEAARAMELAAGIREVLNLQNQADLAAEALSERPNASPLEAIARQQDVAQAADQLAKQSAAEPPPDPAQEGQGQDEAPPGALAEALQRGSEAAAQAAQDILDAKPDQAQAARTETREALEQAFDVAKAEVKRAREASPGKPDLAAQERVGEAAAESQVLAQPDAPKAAETLAEAGQTSEQAEQQVGQGNAEAAAEPQTATADLLEQAESQLAEAVDRLAQQAGEQLAEESRQAGDLTDQAIPVSPGATADLQSAESRAARAGGEVPELPRQAAPAEANIEAAMHEAVADLLAREQQLAHDKALAERLAELATQEQEAADAVGQGALPEPPSPPDPLAGALAEAQRQLAEAARQAAPEGWSPSEPIQQAAALAAAIARAAPPSQTTAPTPTGGGAVQQGEFTENQSPQAAAMSEADVPAEGADGTPDSHNQQAEDRRRRFLEEPWVLRLPAEMRAAIRAGSPRRPPRGYEERLERYFKNID